MSFLQRISTDASNACQDMYSNWILGDDAGKSTRLTLVLRPQLHHNKKSLLDLGMTFIEINGRAYVKSVLPGSAAAAAGIMPQDAVQYVTLFRKEWVYRQQQQQDDFSIHEMFDTNNNNTSQQQQQQHDEATDALATKYALDLESKGLRISYDELRRLLAQALDPTQSAFLSPGAKGWNGPPIPSTVNICVPMERTAQDGYLGLHDGSSESGVLAHNDNNRPSSPYAPQTPRPVVFVLRRTRQRKSLHPHSSSLLPNYRLDDECDFACSLVQRLAPAEGRNTANANTTTWEVSDWLLGQSASSSSSSRRRLHGGGEERAHDIEAETIRGMIQKAVGLAFVRASKIVLGVSIHGGSGVVIARLSDGTWSAPSAVGTWGLGFGLQFGLEVAEYIFILQTEEALEHFRRGGNFTVGGNIGLAAAGMGREAYGAASVSGACGTTSAVRDDEYNVNDSRDENQAPQSMAIAPIVAYAKSQGLYVGVSLEGSRIFSRDDVNSRTYKFDTGRDVTAYDILSGKVPTPTEAEELYAALHSVEFTHEMACLPRPPQILRADSSNAWVFDRDTLGPSSTSRNPFSFLSSLSKEETHQVAEFETLFKNCVYGGFSVQRLLPERESRSGRTARERRTLWLMLPEVGSLRLGFLSKLSDGEGFISNKSSTQRARRDDTSRISGIDNDGGTVGSEELTLDSALNTRVSCCCCNALAVTIARRLI